jgi:NAD(P)-dependent dehydrogenase (short-subunit alcohol dehydrogenase family)
VTVAELCGLDVLVTNMGGPPYGSATEGSDEEWQRAWELVTLSVIRLCPASPGRIAERGGGSFINITTPGVHQLIPATALSTVARMATTGFAKHLATELAPRGVRVNNVMPRWISTRRVRELATADYGPNGPVTRRAMAICSRSCLPALARDRGSATVSIGPSPSMLQEQPGGDANRRQRRAAVLVRIRCRGCSSGRVTRPRARSQPTMPLP